jgi:hypothetical protein
VVRDGDMHNCFPELKAAATTLLVVVLAKPGPGPKAAVMLIHLHKGIPLGLVVQEVAEGNYEGLLSKTWS